MATVDKQQVQPEPRMCPACGTARARLRGVKNGCQLLACGECATLYMAALGVTFDYAQYYDERNTKLPTFLEQRNREIVTRFEPFRQIGRLLEVGFGAGLLCRAALQAGWKVNGIEISSSAVEYARTLGFHVFEGELAEARFPDACFDVVVMSELLEHLPQPAATVGEVARVLRPGGLCWATTPHARGLSARVLGLGWSVVAPPEHLQLFSVPAVRRIFRGAGFRQVSVAAHALNPYELLNAWRRRDWAAGAHPFSRVQSGYSLNRFLLGGWFRRALKRVANGGLSMARLGDSLKIWAVR